ncbi:MAG TPA: 50S ribosomal protein L13 [Candidatus Omnitrophota bacterium]|nr:50S ribosomal protein L13 [Candidatus Omnitrophota bacterium]HQJ15100.1 50S ribosomal protein L13 [Candidatus Omnitrophota bacterium]
MPKTYFPKPSEIKRTWYLVDAKDQILGRCASKIASVLRGKHKAIYTPHVDTGDGVIVINAAQIKVTGRKLKQKLYSRYSGYPGGLKQVPLEQMLEKRPETVMKLAVERMLAKGDLSHQMKMRLKVYKDDKHSNASLKPVPLKI